MQYGMLWGTRLYSNGFYKEAGGMSTEAFMAVWLFNLYMAYKVYRSKAWRIIMTLLYLIALAGRITYELSGEGILWR